MPERIDLFEAIDTQRGIRYFRPDPVPDDHMFAAGDPENKAFWMEAANAAAGLENRFVSVED